MPVHDHHSERLYQLQSVTMHRARSAHLRGLTAGKVWLRIRTDGNSARVRGKDPDLVRRSSGRRGAARVAAWPARARRTGGVIPAGPAWLVIGGCRVRVGSRR